MSALTSIAVPKPRDWQAFERAAVELWTYILPDDGIHRFGRQGQEQYGLDLLGYRNRDAAQLVGIQCKCVRSLDEKTIRAEVERALTYKPDMVEYYVITTADDSTDYAELAMKLTEEYRQKGHKTLIRVWGWGTLEERIQKYPEAHKAFDPNYTPVLQAVVDTIRMQMDQSSSQVLGLQRQVTELQAVVTDGFERRNLVQDEPMQGDDPHAAELNRYRDLMNKGQPRTALTLVQAFEQGLPDDASVILKCRVKSLIGHCYRMMSDFPNAIKQFETASKLSPDDQRGKTAKIIILYLEGKYEDAFNLGKATITEDETNEAAMTWMMFAAAHVSGTIDLDEIVPKSWKSTQAFAEAKLDYLRERNLAPDWWIAAREGRERFPDSRVLRTSDADSQLDELQTITDILDTGEISAEWHEKLMQAAKVLEGEISDIYKSESPDRGDGISLALNASAIYVALRQLDNAKRVLTEALKHNPEASELFLRAAQIAANLGDIELQNQCLPHLGFEGQALNTRIQILDYQNRWQELADLGAKHPLPPHVGKSRVPSEIMLRCAQIRVGSQAKSGRALKRLIEQYTGAASDLIITLNLAEDLERSDLADLAYDKALESIDENSHIIQRVNVAIAANARSDWPAAIKVLAGHINENVDSFELRLVARAHSNQFPVSVRNAEFFDKLPPDIRNAQFYKSLEVHLRYNSGALDRAELLARELHAEHPRNLTFIVMRAFALRRLERIDDLKSFLKSLNVKLLDGTPMQKMQLAHFLADFDRPLDGVDLGYRLVLENPNDPDLALKNLGIVFNKPSGKVELPEVTTIGDRVWIRLEADTGEVDEFIIDSTLPDGIRDVCKPGSDRIRGTLGMSVGDKVNVPRPYDGEQIWTVASIKSCYLHVIHDTIANFNTRFPEHRGFQSFTVKNDDVSPILDVVKKTSISSSSTREKYYELPLPISILSVANNTETIKLFEHLENSPKGVITCIGAADERSVATDLIARNVGAGVVLDMTALWTIFNLDAWDVVKAVFGEIFVPQSVIEKLKELRTEISSRLGGHSGSLAHIDGKFFLHEYNDAETKRHLETIDERIGKIEGTATIETALIPSQAEDLGRQLLTQVDSADMLDPVFVALNRNLLLVTEDSRYGALVRSMFKCPSVWLQPIFNMALQKASITLERYAQLCGELARRKHGFVSFDAITLARLSTSDLDLFKAASEYIGNAEGELSSHLGVVRDFIGISWVKGAPTLSIQQATGYLLGRFMRLFKDSPGVMTAILDRYFSQIDLFREYLYQWRLGHFIPETQEDRRTAWLYHSQEAARAARSHDRKARLLGSISPEVGYESGKA